MSDVGQTSSRSVGAHRQDSSLRRERRPSPEMEGSPPPPALATRTPSSSGPSVAATRRGPPRHKLTASTNASAPPVQTRMPTSRTSSESPGIMKSSSPKATRHPSSEARVTMMTTQQQSVDAHEVPTISLGKLRPLLGALSTPKQRRIKFKRSDEPRKIECTALKGTTAASPRSAHTPKHEQSSLHPVQASASAYPATAKVSSSQVVTTSRTRQRSAAASLSRCRHDTKSQSAVTTAFPPPSKRLRKKNKVNSSKAMGDAACYGAWKTEMQESTKMNTRATMDKVRRPDGVSTGGVRSTAFLRDLSRGSSTSESRPGALAENSPTRRLQDITTSQQPAELVGNATTSPTGGLEDLRRGPDALPDEGALEVTVDITRRHHVPDAARNLAVSNADRSSFSSIVERILATIMIRPGNVRSTNGREPSRRVDPVQPEPNRLPQSPLVAEFQQDKKQPSKPQEDLEYGSPVDYERFLPHSKEALSYTELIKYPEKGRKSSAKPSTTKPKDVEDSNIPDTDTQHGLPVDYERFLLDSKEALRSPEPLGRKSSVKQSTKKQMKPEESKNPREHTDYRQPVNNELSLPQCIKPLSKTELLEHTKSPQKLSANPSDHQLVWGTQGVRGVSPPVCGFSWSSPKSVSPASPTGHPSPSKPIGASQRETTAPPIENATPTVAIRNLSGGVRDSNEHLNKPTTLKKLVDKKTEETPRRVSVPIGVKADSSTKPLSRSASSLMPPQKGPPDDYPGQPRTTTIRPLGAAFQGAERQQEHGERKLYDFSSTTPSTVEAPNEHLSKKAIPAEQTAPSSTEVKSVPDHLLTMTGHDESRGVEQKPVPTQIGPLALPEKVSDLHSNLSSPQPEPVTRQFKGFVHGTPHGGKASAGNAKLIISVKGSSTLSPEASQKTAAIRTFVTNVRQTMERLEAKPVAHDQKFGKSHALASKMGTEVQAPKYITSHTLVLKDSVKSKESAKDEGKTHATPAPQKDAIKSSEALASKPPEQPQPAFVAKPTTGLPTQTRVLKMSTMDKGFREMMLWDYGPTPPQKTPLLHDKDRPAARITATIPQKEIAAPQQPATPSPQVSKQARPSLAKAAALQPAVPASDPAKEPMPETQKAKVSQEETAAPDKAGELELATSATKITKHVVVSPVEAAAATKVPERKDNLVKPLQASAASKQQSQTKPDVAIAADEATKLGVADTPGVHKTAEKPAKTPIDKHAASNVQPEGAIGKDASPDIARPTKAALLKVKKSATDSETGIKGLKSPPEKTQSVTTPSTDTKSPEMKPALHTSPNVLTEQKSTSSPETESKASPETKRHAAEIVSHKSVTGEKHKAHTYKCVKHMNETEAEYRVRKDKAKAKARLRAIAIATAQDIFHEEEQVSYVRGPVKKKKRKMRKRPPPEKEATDHSGKEDKKGRIVVTSDHHTKTGICPCCIIILIILLILIALLYLFWPSPVEETTTIYSTQLPPTNQTSHRPVLGTYYCSSDVCSAEAKYLNSLLSTNKKPCDNFYEYVCEGWSRAHAVPGVGAGGVLSTDTILQDSLANDIEPVLLGMQDADVKIAAGLHEDCMKRDKVGQDGDTVINVARQLFRDWAIKEWPVLKSATITTEVAWMFAGELVRDLNVAALASVSVGINPRVLEAAAIELDKPRLVFSCNDASRPAVTKLFKDALKEVMSRFAAASTAINGEVDSVMSVFVRLASSPTFAASPDTTPLSYTNVQLVELDGGYKTFLVGVFNNIVKIDGTTEVVLKSPDYLRNHLKAAMQELSPHAVVNYLGFMALVKAAPFFPEKFSNLRQIFGKDVLDRTLPDVSQTKTLCLLAVQKVLPVCFAKATANLRAMHHIDLPLAEWLSRLGTVFVRHQEQVAWIDELSALIVRYRLGRNRMAAFPSGGTFSQEPCAPSPHEIPRRSEHPLRFFHQVSVLQEQKRLQLVLKPGQHVRALRGDARSELATVPEYDVMRQAVHVPMALFNTSVPTNTTMFSFHLSRVAVRLYRAMVQVLFPNNIYERDAPLALTGDMARRLDKLLSCFEEDLSKLPAEIRGPVSIDSAKFRGALLQHTAAVRLAFRAFEDLHSVRRIWNVDFRFKDLPDFSSNALFFLYYALDNCESSDTVYEEHHGPWMPAHYRVNAALRHDPNFASEFGCTGQYPMTAKKACDVLKDGH